MGCDVHAFLEAKIDGAWRHYGEVHIDRSYEVFEAMGHVARGTRDVEEIAPLRGFPKDADFMTRVHFERRWGPDGHSPSWLSSCEMEALDAWWRGAKDRATLEYEVVASLFSHERSRLWFFGNNVDSWWRYPGDRPAFVEDVRLVFWFDN